MDSGGLDDGAHCASCDNPSSLGGRLQKDFSTPEIYINFVVNRLTVEPHTHHTTLSSMYGLLNRRLDILALAYPDANATLSVADHYCSAEAKTATAFNYSRDAIDLHYLLCKFGGLSLYRRAASAASLLCLWGCHY